MGERMRVLIYCDDPGCGGTAINAGLLAAGLAEAGLDVTLAASTDITGGASGVVYIPIDYDTMRLSVKTAAGRTEPEAIFMAVRPDLVCFTDGGVDSSLAAKAICQEWGLPYLVHVNFVSPCHPVILGGRIAEVVQANAAALAVVAVSRENLSLLRQAFGVSPERSGVIHYGRPLEFFEPVGPVVRAERRASLGLGPADILCLTVARFEQRKGYRHLLRAAALLARYPTGTHIYFAAIGHDVDNGQQSVQLMMFEAGLSGRMTLLGQRGDVREWLGAADIFVLPSESEGMPLSITEAMAQGLPVVASAVSGIPEQLGDTGILLPDPNLDPEATAQALAMALAALARDPVVRRALGQAARQRARTYFAAPAMLRSWLSLLASLAPAIANASPCFPDPVGYVPPNIAPLGRDIPLGKVTAVEFLKEGWSHAEAAGRWTSGRQARIGVGLPVAARDGFVLELSGWPYLGKGEATVTLVVSVAGRQVGRFVWSDEPNSLEVAFFCQPYGGRFPAQVDIVLAIDGASSPADHGEGADARVLGFFVTRLRLTDLGRSSQGEL